MLKKGLNEIIWKDGSIKVYVQSPHEKLGMISAAGNPVWTALQRIDKIDDNRIHNCKVNANYFNMRKNSGEYKQHYGVEITPQASLWPPQAGWYAVWQHYGDKTIYMGRADVYNYTIKEVEWAASPAAILVHNGVAADYYSTAISDIETKKTKKYTQTLLLQFADDTIGLACVSNMNLYDCREFALEYGCKHCSAYDSGGSTQMIVKGQKIVYTGRAIANALTLYQVAEPSIEEPKPQNPTEPFAATEYEIQVKKIGLYLRESLSFNGIYPTGKKAGLLKVGESVRIVEFIPTLQPDGYQWIKVIKDNNIYYVQYDSQAYIIKHIGGIYGIFNQQLGCYS